MIKRITKKRIRFWYGGPDDGMVREFVAPYSEFVEIQGPIYTRTDEDGIQWVGHKVYKYVLRVIGGRLTYVYSGERLDERYGAHRAEPAGEVTPMAIRKHGVGEIIDDAETEENLSKQAATSDWSDKDEDALHDENEG